MMRTLLFFLLFLSSSVSAKIYDCFLFFNELELLEVRLNELYDAVDYFVIVESAETHRKGDPKPFYFEEAKERFAKFANKIIHIKVNEHFETDDPWQREAFQRNQIIRGLKNCHPEDLILISDADEFIPGALIRKLYIESFRTPIIGFVQSFYRFFLNRTTGEVWSGTAALRYKHLVKISPQEVRYAVRLTSISRIPLWRAGWHFSTMGGYERTFEKSAAIVEGNDVRLTYEQWRAHVNDHPLVPIDQSYPQFVQDNIEYLIEVGLIDAP